MLRLKPSVGALVAVALTACTPDLSVPTQAMIECDGTEACPEGFHCDQPLGRCVHQAAPPVTLLAPSVDVTECMAPTDGSSDFVCGAALEMRAGSHGAVQGCLVLGRGHEVLGSFPVVADAAAREAWRFVLPDDSPQTEGVVGDSLTGRLFLLAPTAAASDSCAEFLLHTDCRTRASCVAALPPVEGVVGLDGGLVLRNGPEPDGCGVVCGDSCEEAEGSACVRACYSIDHPPLDVCDGQDNDCDGATDEPPLEADAPCPGQGECMPRCAGAHG